MLHIEEERWRKGRKSNVIKYKYTVGYLYSHPFRKGSYHWSLFCVCVCVCV